MTTHSQNPPHAAQPDIPPDLWGNNNKLSPRRVASRLREQRVLAMRADGMTWAKIAEVEGLYDGRSAKEVCKRALRNLSAPMDVESERNMVNAQLDKTYADLVAGTIDDKLAGAIIKTLQSKIKLLGLAVPVTQKTEHSGDITHRAAPMSPEDTLAAVEAVQRMVGEAAAREVESREHQRDAELMQLDAIAEGEIVDVKSDDDPNA